MRANAVQVHDCCYLEPTRCTICRDHILNIKDAPAPKPVGKGAKRTLEQATAAPPATTAAAAAAPAQPSQDNAAAAQAPADAPTGEAQPSPDGEDPGKQEADAQAQTAQDAVQQHPPALAQDTAQAAGSDQQAGSTAAASTATVSVCSCMEPGMASNTGFSGHASSVLQCVLGLPALLRRAFFRR